jgi:hypothetical protein
MSDTPQLTTVKGDVEIAEDLKRRIEETCAPLALLMDEAAAHGFQVVWDNFSPGPPKMRFRMNGLRLIKVF